MDKVSHKRTITFMDPYPDIYGTTYPGIYIWPICTEQPTYLCHVMFANICKRSMMKRVATYGKLAYRDAHRAMPT